MLAAHVCKYLRHLRLGVCGFLANSCATTWTNDALVRLPKRPPACCTLDLVHCCVCIGCIVGVFALVTCLVAYFNCMSGHMFIYFEYLYEQSASETDQDTYTRYCLWPKNSSSCSCPEWNFPGIKNDPTPCRSISHSSGESKPTFSAQISFCRFLGFGPLNPGNKIKKLAQAMGAGSLWRHR